MIGLLEKKETTSRLNRDSLTQSLHFEVSPIDSIAASTIGHVLVVNASSYRPLTTLRDKVEAVEHLVRIDAFKDTESLVYGFKCHFEWPRVYIYRVNIC